MSAADRVIKWVEAEGAYLCAEHVSTWWRVTVTIGDAEPISAEKSMLERAFEDIEAKIVQKELDLRNVSLQKADRAKERLSIFGVVS